MTIIEECAELDRRYRETIKKAVAVASGTAPALNDSIAAGKVSRLLPPLTTNNPSL